MNNGQPIIDSEDEKMGKQNKHVVKRKTRLNNLHALIEAPTTVSIAFLLSCLAPVSHLRSPTSLLSHPGSSIYLLLLFAYLGTPTTLLSHLILALVLRSLAILLFFLLLGPTPFHLVSATFGTFK